VRTEIREYFDFVVKRRRTYAYEFWITDFVGLTVTLTETQRKAAIMSPLQCGIEARQLEDWLETQQQRF
jgi:hypothetical protein